MDEEAVKKKEEISKAREERDTFLIKERATLDAIQKEIFTYNKRGKEAKLESKILDKVSWIIANPPTIDKVE